MARSEFVTFRGGFIARLDVVERLLDLERRGAQFALLADGGFRVEPADVLTPDDSAFLKAHRDEARAVVRYQADDAHLFTDVTLAQPRHVPGRQERTA
jgi:hypothetical protein